MLKKNSKYYYRKRTKDWIICKGLKDEDFVVCGYYMNDKYTSLILGLYKQEKMIYQSHVTLGVSNEDLKKITSKKNVNKKDHCEEFSQIEGTIWIIYTCMYCKIYGTHSKRCGLKQLIF